MSKWGIETTGEIEIVKLLKGRFSSAKILYEGKRGGPDLVVYDNERHKLMIFEVRGVPTMLKVKGGDKGRRKSEDTIESQFWGRSGEALIELIEREHDLNTCIQKRLCNKKEWVRKVVEGIGGIDRLKTAKVRYICVLGHRQEYKKHIEKRLHAIRKLNYEVWLMKPNGEIEVMTQDHEGSETWEVWGNPPPSRPPPGTSA